MRQTKVLNTEPMIKIGEVRISEDQTVKALIACFKDHDTNEIYEFPMLPPIAEIHQEMVNEAMKDLPAMTDLVVPGGPISEADLARMAAAAISGKAPPGS